jgi:hypothetical protein
MQANPLCPGGKRRLDSAFVKTTDVYILRPRIGSDDQVRWACTSLAYRYRARGCRVTTGEIFGGPPPWALYWEGGCPPPSANAGLYLVFHCFATKSTLAVQPLAEVIVRGGLGCVRKIALVACFSAQGEEDSVLWQLASALAARGADTLVAGWDASLGVVAPRSAHEGGLAKVYANRSGRPIDYDTYIGHKSVIYPNDWGSATRGGIKGKQALVVGDFRQQRKRVVRVSPGQVAPAPLAAWHDDEWPAV